MVGQSVSHYRIVDHLGQGGMGVVYRAEDTRLKRPVALKFFPSDLADDPEAVTRFEREARAASALDHPNICTVYEVDETDEGRTFIAMACYDGTTLKSRIEDGPLSLAEIVRIGTQIADGLAEAHRKDIVHRDLKPANVMITPDGVVKILDFGLALLAGESRITKSNAVAGTPSYMAPEQVRGEEADHRADIWALGAMLYEMAVGKPAFTGEYVEAVIYQVMHGEVTIPSDVDEGLADIIRCCLRKDPADRFESAAAVREAIQSLVRSSERDAGHRKRASASLVAAGFAVVVLFAVGIGRFPSEALTGWLFPGPKIEQRHIAVLPMRVISSMVQADVYGRGLMEVLTSKLTQLEPYSESSYWVVPTSEILEREVASASEARKVFGANYVIDALVQHDASNVRLTLNLIDAESLRQIDTWTGDFTDASTTAIQDEAALRVAEMLMMSAGDDVRDDIRRAGTADIGANEYYIQGRGYLQRFDNASNIETAISLFHRALAQDPNFILAAAGLAEAHWRMYEATRDVAFADSALVYGRSVESRRDLPAPVYAALGLVYEGTGRTQLALETFDRARRLDPNNVDALRGQASALAALGRMAEAEAAYLEAIRRRPDYWAGYHELGIFYYGQGELDKAIEQFLHEIELTPDNARAHSSLGGLYFNIGEWDRSERYLQRSIELRPSYRAYSNLGTLYFHRGELDKAAAMFRKALDIQSTDYNVWAYLATAYRFSSQPDSSRRAFRRSVELAEERLDLVPGDAAASVSIVMSKAALGRDAEALRELEEILPTDASNESLAYSIAQSYEILGRRDEAIRWINEALEHGLNPAYPQRNVWLTDLRRDPDFALNLSTQQR